MEEEENGETTGGRRERVKLDFKCVFLWSLRFAKKKKKKNDVKKE